MMPTDKVPQALFGGPLLGDRAVRFVFVDEAGIAEPDPFRIVAAIIAHADHHLVRAEALIAEILRAVPPEFRDRKFSAKDVWGNQMYKDRWGFPDRRALVLKLMGVPAKLKMALAVGVAERGGQDYDELVKQHGGRWPFDIEARPFEHDHMAAFDLCLTKADMFIRDHAEHDEVGTVIVEDTTEMRDKLRRVVRWRLRNPIMYSASELLRNSDEEAAGYAIQRGDVRIERLRKWIHFVPKGEDPMLIVADAVAFGFRRYFAGEPWGDECADAILNHRPAKEDFSGPPGAAYFAPR